VEEHADPEGGGRLVGGLFWLVEDHAIGHLHGGQVVSQGNQWGEDLEEHGGVDHVNPFPGKVGDSMEAWGRRGE